MNIFKLFIPKENAQVVEEVESYKVSWIVNQIYLADKNFKCFIKRPDAEEFEKQIKEAAKLLKINVSTNLEKN